MAGSLAGSPLGQLGLGQGQGQGLSQAHSPLMHSHGLGHGPLGMSAMHWDCVVRGTPCGGSCSALSSASSSTTASSSSYSGWPLAMPSPSPSSGSSSSVGGGGGLHSVAAASPSQRRDAHPQAHAAPWLDPLGCDKTGMDWYLHKSMVGDWASTSPGWPPHAPFM